MSGVCIHIVSMAMIHRMAMETANREIEIKIIHMEMALKLADFPFEKLITVKMSMSYAYYS